MTSSTPDPAGTLFSSSLHPDTLADWVGEGPVTLTAGESGVILASAADADMLGDHAHFTLWCPHKFPDHIRISWDYRPLSGQGLAMLFFGAHGSAGRDLFAPELARRTGYYPQYHSGDIATLHVSYHRHKHASERAFRSCNLRKSPGFKLVAQGADPLPNSEDAEGFYRIEVVKDGPRVSFSINGLPLFSWSDEAAPDAVIRGGRLGFRQMAPLRAEYRNLRVEALPER